MPTSLMVLFANDIIKEIHLAGLNAVDVKRQMTTWIKEVYPEFADRNIEVKFTGENPNIFDNSQSSGERGLKANFYIQGQGQHIQATAIIAYSLSTQQRIPKLDQHAISKILTFLYPCKILEARVSHLLKESAIMALKSHRVISKNTLLGQSGYRFLSLTISNNSCYALITNEKDVVQIFAWGENTSGQLGLGDNENRNIPTLVQLPQGFRLEQLVMHTGSTFAIGSNAQKKPQILAWGLNNRGQLGLENNEDKNFPTPIQLPQGFRLGQLIASYESTFAIGSNAEGDPQIFAWGLNNRGQLGIGDNENRNAPTLVQVPQGFRLGQLIASYEITFVIGRDAQGDPQILAWGANEHGQLGLEDNEDRNVPTPMQLPQGFRLGQLIASYASIFAIGSNAQNNSQILAWGRNQFGQLGLEDNENRNVPTLIHLPQGFRPKQLIICSQSTFVIENNAQDNPQILAWGRNDRGQLGVGDNLNKNVPTLIQLPQDFRLKQLLTNGGVTFAIGSDTQDNPQILAWGRNDRGKLGVGDNLNKNVPTLVQLPQGFRPEQLVTNGKRTFAIGSNTEGDPQILAWGTNQHGQLGLVHNNDILIPQEISVVGLPNPSANKILKHLSP